jgi:uncharacterized protein YhaN
MLPDYKLIQELRNRYLGQGVDSLTRSEVCDLINHLHEAVSDKDQTIADLRTQLAELAQCRDHWKISCEELRQWKESAMLVLSKIDLQAIGKEIGVRLGHDISPEILPWIIKAKAKLAEKEGEWKDWKKCIDALTTHCESLQRKLSLYRKAVGPVKECVAMEESGIVIPSKVMEAFRTCIRILGEADLLKERTEGE